MNLPTSQEQPKTKGGFSSCGLAATLLPTHAELWTVLPNIIVYMGYN